MPRKKKDGRYINYYIDRAIYERFEAYAEDKGQPMTTALERILKEHLDWYDAENRNKGGFPMFCPKCNLIVNAVKCPVCGSRNVREPEPEDYCFLTEKEIIWAGALSDILTQNEIHFLTKDVLGAGLAAKLGSALERTRFYVPYAQLSFAQELEREFFSADFPDESE